MRIKVFLERFYGIEYLAVVTDKFYLAVFPHFIDLVKAHFKDFTGSWFIDILVEGNLRRVFAQVVYAGGEIFDLIFQAVDGYYDIKYFGHDKYELNEFETNYTNY